MTSSSSTPCRAIEAANSVSSPRWRRGLCGCGSRSTTGTRRNSANAGAAVRVPTTEEDILHTSRIRGWWSARKRGAADRATTIRPFDLDAFRFRVRLFECRTGLGMTGEQQLAISFGGHEFVAGESRRPQQLTRRRMIPVHDHIPGIIRRLIEPKRLARGRIQPPHDRRITPRAPPRPRTGTSTGRHSTPPTTVTVTIGRPPRGRAITFPAASTITHGRSCHNDSHARSNAARWERYSGSSTPDSSISVTNGSVISCTRTCGTDDAHSDRHRCSPRHTHAPSNTLSSPGWARSDHWRSPAPARPPHSSATTPE